MTPVCNFNESQQSDEQTYQAFFESAGSDTVLCNDGEKFTSLVNVRKGVARVAGCGAVMRS